ncbi:MAG: DMT family transporter [Propionibacteriaceae bacterium]
MIAVLLACSAAAVFAAGSSLQHRAASSVPRANASTTGLVGRLLRRPSWLLGILLSAVAFALHVAALRHGSLTLVQPIVVSNIVFAVFVRAALDRHLPPRQEIAWAVVTWAGLALFIAMLENHVPPHATHPHAPEVFVVSGAVLTVVAVACAQRAHKAALRGFLLASAAGLLYGLTAGLIKVVIVEAASGRMAVLQHWSFWAMLVVAPNALLLSQRAYHAARLSITMPILNIVDVLVAITFGITVFGERIFSSPVHLVGELTGLLLMGVGVWQLARQEEIELHQTSATSVDQGGRTTP